MSTVVMNSQATLDHRKASQVQHLYKEVLRALKALCGNVASRSWRYLFLKANNIGSLKSDGHLTFFRGIYLSLMSLYIEHDNMK